MLAPRETEPRLLHYLSRIPVCVPSVFGEARADIIRGSIDGASMYSLLALGADSRSSSVIRSSVFRKSVDARRYEGLGPHSHVNVGCRQESGPGR